MTKVLDFIYKILSILMLVMLVIMVGSISYNVIARYIGKAAMWIDEISRLTFVWMSFTAIIIGFRDNMHPAFEMLLENLGRTNKKLLLTIINIFILIFLAFVFKGGVDYAFKASVQKTAILGISVSWKYAVIPLSSLVMFLEAIKKLKLIWKN